jgi:hypothetical protein
MEFTYRISEADYLAAAKMRRASMGNATVQRVLFWCFVLVCLVVLWGVVSRSSTHTSSNSGTQVQSSDSSSDETETPASTKTSFIYNVGPFVVLVFVWGIGFYNMGPRRLRKLYRNDPAMQGEISVDITTGSFSSRNTTGSTSQSGWNIYERWIEGKNLVLLVMRNRLYVILNVAGLTETQRTELRSILSAALPRK